MIKGIIMSSKIHDYILKLFAVAALFTLSPSFDFTDGFKVSLVKNAEAFCYMSGSGSHHTLHCMRPRFPNSAPSLGYWGWMLAGGGMAGSGVWDQGEDWSGDDASTDYEKDMAELGYDIRTGHIDAKEACEIAAQIDQNYCHSGHQTAAGIVGSACSLIAGVATSVTAGTLGVSACAAAVGIKLNGEMDDCDVAHAIRVARCD